MDANFNLNIFGSYAKNQLGFVLKILENDIT